MLPYTTRELTRSERGEQTPYRRENAEPAGFSGAFSALSELGQYISHQHELLGCFRPLNQHLVHQSIHQYYKSSLQGNHT